MTDKPTVAAPGKPGKISHPGMLGDGTEEQNLNQTGDPSLRIKAEDVDAAFDKNQPKKP